MSQDLIIAIDSIAGNLCQAALLYPKVSSSVSLLYLHILLLLFIFHLSNTFLAIPDDTWGLGVPGFSGVLCPTVSCTGQGFYLAFL